MHTYILYAAYGWLTWSGTLHFVIDVMSQYLRGKRAASTETTLYSCGMTWRGLLCSAL
jgi:hypothetical protein